MHPHEVTLNALFQRAMNEEIGALKTIIRMFEKAGLLKAMEEPIGPVVIMPKELPLDFSLLLGEKLEPPPWSDADIAKYKPEYLASRDELAVIRDEIMEFE